MDYNKKRDIALGIVIALLLALSAVFISIGIAMLKNESGGKIISGAKYVMTSRTENRG